MTNDCFIFVNEKIIELVKKGVINLFDFSSSFNRVEMCDRMKVISLEIPEIENANKKNNSTSTTSTTSTNNNNTNNKPSPNTNNTNTNNTNTNNTNTNNTNNNLALVSSPTKKIMIAPIDLVTNFKMLIPHIEIELRKSEGFYFFRFLLIIFSFSTFFLYFLSLLSFSSLYNLMLI